jgi:hypothetical protein
LPHSNYLIELSDYCTQNPNTGGGGLYLSVQKDTSVFGSAFYNYVCNSWIRSHVSPHGDTTVLLGGCCFYPRHVLKNKNISFPEHKPRAGEEMDFNSDILKQGCTLQFDERWSVYHNPGYALEDIFKRAWLHGLSIERNSVIPPVGRLSNFASDSKKNIPEFIKFLPMTVAYGLWGRAAYVSKIFQKQNSKLLAPSPHYKQDVLPPYK